MTLNLGDQVPIAVTTFAADRRRRHPDAAAGDYQYRPVGVNLTITPRVTYQDEIILDPIIVDKSGLGPNINVAGSVDSELRHPHGVGVDAAARRRVEPARGLDPRRGARR